MLFEAQRHRGGPPRGETTFLPFSHTPLHDLGELARQNRAPSIKHGSTSETEAPATKLRRFFYLGTYRRGEN